MVRQHYVITYTAEGKPPFVRIVPAESPMQALQQGEWMLDGEHIHDHAAYSFDRMERRWEPLPKVDPAAFDVGDDFEGVPV